MITECCENRAFSELTAYLDTRDDSNRRDWEAHLATCGPCRESAYLYTGLRRYARQWADQALISPCGGPGYEELDEFLRFDEAGRTHERFRGVARHLRSCADCRDLADAIDEHYEPSLLERLRRRLDPGALRDSIAGFFEQVESLLANPFPALAPAELGAGFLRAGAPIDTLVRLPFDFSWALYPRAVVFELVVTAETPLGPHEELVRLPAPQTDDLVRHRSDALDMRWVPDRVYTWTVTALDCAEEALATSDPLTFSVASDDRLERVDRLLMETDIKVRSPNMSALASALILSREGLHDDAVALLELEGARKSPVLAAGAASLYRRRCAEARRSEAARHLETALAEWEGVLGGL